MAEQTVQQTIELHPHQLEFFNDESPFLAAITGIAGGKSYVGCVKAVAYALRHPGMFGMITAPSYTILHDATIKTFFEIAQPNLIASYNKNDREVTFKNGSKFVFRSTHDPQLLRGPTTSYLYMDEAAQSSEEAFLILIGRNRDKRFPLRFVITTTPKGRAHWIYRTFCKPELPDGYKLHTWTSFDNIFNHEDFFTNVRQAYSGQFAKQELYGEFLDLSGLVYGEHFNEHVHVGNYEFNPKIPVMLGIDFGFADPSVCLAFQQDAVGHVFLFDEIYGKGISDEDMVEQLKGKEYWHNITAAYCDGARPDRIDNLCNFGLRKARKAEHDGGGKDNIDLGIQKVIELLKVDPILKTPRLFIDRTCVDTIREFGLYSYPNKPSGHNINQKPVDAHNHTSDALRYFVVSAISPKKATFERKVVGPIKRRLMAFDRRR